MEKGELISEVAKTSGISEEEALKVIDAFTDTIKESLIKGEKITISGFGTFSLSKRKPREFVNPKTQQVHSIPERFLPHFKAGRNFRKQVLK